MKRLEEVYTQYAGRFSRCLVNSHPPFAQISLLLTIGSAIVDELDQNQIGPDGMTKFLTDLEVDPEDVVSSLFLSLFPSLPPLLTPSSGLLP